MEICGEKVILRDLTKEDIEKRLYFNTVDTEWQMWDSPWQYEGMTKEEKEYETIEEDISKMEDRIAEIEEEMAAKASDYSALNKLMEEKETLEEALLEKMERWEYLEDLAQRIEEQNH